MKRLAISNLALPTAITPELLKELKTAGIQGIEVAPTRLGSWAELTDERLDGYRWLLADHGLVVSSLASLCFDTTELHLLGSQSSFEKMLAHLQRVAAIGSRLGAELGVFGSPRNRLRGDMSANAAAELGQARLRTLAETVAAEGFCLGLEPVPAAYGGDFLSSAAEVIAMVQAVDHLGLRVHLDTGCVLLGGDQIADAVTAAGSALAHFHITEPKLGSFHAPLAEHAAAAGALQKIGYQGWLAIEMLEQNPDAMSKVKEAICVARNFYLCSM
jgi:sugar phosphate isomerase/epimerase